MSANRPNRSSCPACRGWSASTVSRATGTNGASAPEFHVRSPWPGHPMTCQRCHVANLAHNIPHPQLTREGYQPRTHAFSLLARLGEVKPYLVCFSFWIPQFVDIARGSTRGVWWLVSLLHKVHWAHRVPVWLRGTAKWFWPFALHAPFAPRACKLRRDQCSSCLPRLPTLPRFQLWEGGGFPTPERND